MAAVIPANSNDRSLNLLIVKSNNGDPQSMLALGLKFALGTGGVQYNEDRAVNLITGAAELGYLPAKQWILDNSIAQVRVALLCEKKIKDKGEPSNTTKKGNKTKRKQTKKVASGKSNTHDLTPNGVKKHASKTTTSKNVPRTLQHSKQTQTPSHSTKPLSTYEQAIRLLSDSSESSQKGMSLMGKAVFSGDYRALKWVTDKADNGNCDAIFILGKAYATGLGVTVSKEKARTYLEAINPITPNAEYYLGLISLRDDPSNAVQHICNAASKGHWDAIRWVRQNMDNSRTFTHLISCYMDGFHDSVLEKKISESALNGNLKAVKAITKDALNGSKDALCTAGKLYEFGIGVEKSADKAYDLYSRSATPESYFRAAEILMNRGEASISRIVNMYYIAAVRGYRDARSRLLLFVDRGDPSAMYYIGKLYDKDRDFTNALRMMRKAASTGSESAQEWLNEQKESIRSDSDSYIGPYGDVSW